MTTPDLIEKLKQLADIHNKADPPLTWALYDAAARIKQLEKQKSELQEENQILYNIITTIKPTGGGRGHPPGPKPNLKHENRNNPKPKKRPPARHQPPL